MKRVLKNFFIAELCSKFYPSNMGSNGQKTLDVGKCMDSNGQKHWM
jgi:hypothetical protein